MGIIMKAKSASKTKGNAAILPYMVLGLIALCVMLTGCEMYAPSRVSESRVQIEEKRFSDVMPVATFNDVAVKRLADHHRRHGDGAVEVTVTYDSSRGSALRAADEVGVIRSRLIKAGVEDVLGSILPVKNMGRDMNVMIAYNAINALAPRDCTMMSGFEGHVIEADEDYKLGCTRESLYARQISRAKDLKGRKSNMDLNDGRRITNSIESVRAGETSPSLNGKNASE